MARLHGSSQRVGVTRRFSDLFGWEVRWFADPVSISMNQHLAKPLRIPDRVTLRIVVEVSEDIGAFL